MNNKDADQSVRMHRLLCAFVVRNVFSRRGHHYNFRHDKFEQYYTTANLVRFIAKVYLYPRYEVYRGYIVFAFSVIMFVCLFVCNVFYLSKICQQIRGLGF